MTHAGARRPPGGPKRAQQASLQLVRGAAAVLICWAGCAFSAPHPVSSTALMGPLIDPPALDVRPSDIATTVHDRVRAAFDPLLGPLGELERAQLTALYAEKHAPLWLDAAGRPTPNVIDALTLLDGAADEGLVPGDYAAAPLRHLEAAFTHSLAPSASALAGFDVAMSAATLRYFHDLHLGRVDPRTIGFRLTLPADRHDFAPILRAALAGSRILETAAELAPPLVQYQALRDMLTRYRSLAARATFGPMPPDTLRLGDRYPGLPALRDRLVALGDLPLETPVPSGDTSYEGALVDGVKRYQIRHGLEADGIVGRATHAALRVPLAWRVRQIELALERLRWLPDLGERRVLALNIPMFHLWGWDSITTTEEPSVGMRAIVGRALRTQTPVFDEEMSHVIFRPYWNIPPSILRNEILPLVKRDPDYLRRHDMELVRGQSDAADPVPATAENIALLERGVLRLRQRPGPQNALGLVKFVFPNDENVYLHGTPAQVLFGRSRRDFSHGCVRVAEPAALAAWVLKDRPEWGPDRIREAMEGAAPTRVDLARPIQVILFYVTAVVRPEDGTIHFAEDIYGHDTALDDALARERSAAS